MIYKFKNNFFVRALSEKDMKGNYLEWFQDPEISKYNSHGKFFKTEKYYKEYIINAINSNEMIVWAICSPNKKHIGNVSLSHIDKINKSADLSIIIGNKIYWSKGIASIVSKKLIDHGFNKLNLNRITCATAEVNLGMNLLAKKLGMKKEGLRRKSLFLDGKYINCIEYGILRSEFYK
jgi:RimJ/RimL family protein N-acetyltransferase